MNRPEAYKDFDLTDRPVEVWKDVVGWEGCYMISNKGRLKSLDRTVKTRNQTTEFEVDLIGKVIKGNLIGKGYLQVDLGRINGKRICRLIHVLVGIHFVENPDLKPQLNHKDGIKVNNDADNLEWCTQSENIKHAYNTGLNSNEGVKNPASKLTEEEVRRIRKGFEGRYVIKWEEYGAIASQYNMSDMAIFNLVHKKTYKNIN